MPNSSTTWNTKHKATHSLTAFEQLTAVFFRIRVLWLSLPTRSNLDVHAIRHAQHMKSIAFGFDSIDVREAVLADVLVLRLQSVAST